MESGAELQLIVERFPSFVQITISDNGAGMAEQVLQSMLTLNESTVKGFSGSNRTRNSTGLGTQNVFRRLVLFYGKDADEETLNRLIKIQSAENMGTSIILTLPYRNKECSLSENRP
jgi:sensor histidine kinase YesM